MKIIAIGDTHGRDNWRTHAGQPFDYFIFIGDYFDSQTIKTNDQIQNFIDIMEFKKSNPRVITLIGNHDFHYLPYCEGRYSGYQTFRDFDIKEVLRKYEYNLQACFTLKNTVFSHAGITNTFLKNNDCLVEQLNDLFRSEPEMFNFTGSDPYGNDIRQTPIWVRPRALIQDKVEEWKQVVGHTRQNMINEVEGVTFIDCLDMKDEVYVADL